MKKNIIFLVFIFFLSCKSIDSQIVSQGNIDNAIMNSIIDFKKTKLFKTGAVFSVLENNEEEFYKITIISKGKNKYLYSKQKKAKENKLPSRYYETDNKLFIWWDENHEVTDKNIEILNKYDMLVDDEGGNVWFLESSSDDSKKGATYFICKNDLKNYKRVISSTSSSTLPNLKCNK
ncbi:hypothetical protein [Flavobacterium mekongense]|uniref:hypothetical protein n=1 Tax=Flavobacterium mekongense TaxID=3379707 RepID=UPI00399ADF75